MIRRTWRPLALAASLIFLVLGIAVPANAQTEEEHCVVLLDDDVAVDQQVVVCASTIEGAAAAFTEQTGYTIVDSAEDENTSFASFGPLVVYSLAQLYVDANYGGSSYLFTRSSPCNGVTQAGVSNLVSYGLNDQISSFLTYSTCEVRLYDDINYAGGTYGYTTTQSSLPSFNDRASSARAR